LGLNYVTIHKILESSNWKNTDAMPPPAETEIYNATLATGKSLFSVKRLNTPGHT